MARTDAGHRNFKLSEEDKPLLDKLTLPHRQILLAEGSYSQIAAAIGVAVGTVRSRLNRARAALTKARGDAALTTAIAADEAVPQ